MTAELLDRRTPTARVAHCCYNCGDRIEPGDTYERQSIAYDGTVWTYKSHEACHTISLAYGEYHALSDDEMPYWGVWGDVLRWWNEERPDA